jgi:hypothetical protein
MSWQEEEIRKREEQERKIKCESELITKEITIFWNKLIQANAMIDERISATHRITDVYNRPKESLLGLHECLTCEGEYIESTEESRSIIYDKNKGCLIICLEAHTHYKGVSRFKIYHHILKDSDIDIILKDICTGIKFYKSIQSNYEKVVIEEIEKEIDAEKKNYENKYKKSILARIWYNIT